MCLFASTNDADGIGGAETLIMLRMNATNIPRVQILSENMMMDGDENKSSSAYRAPARKSIAGATATRYFQRKAFFWRSKAARIMLIPNAITPDHGPLSRNK
jgi:hypothetical protein